MIKNSTSKALAYIKNPIAQALIVATKAFILGIWRWLVENVLWQMKIKRVYTLEIIVF